MKNWCFQALEVRNFELISSKRHKFFMKLLVQMYSKTFLEVPRRHPRYLEGPPTSGLDNTSTFMVVQPTNHFLLKQTWASRSFWRNQLEISDFQSLKTPIFHETFASNASKNFSRGRKKSSKVSRRPPTSGLYNAPTPMVIRPTNHFLFKKKVNPPSGTLFWKPLLYVWNFHISFIIWL